MNAPLSCLCLAPPGMHKTAGLAVPNLLGCGNSMIIHDMKGELYALTACKREVMFDSDIVLFQPGHEACGVFNPLASNMLPEDEDECHRYIKNIAGSLIPVKGNRDDFFIQAAQSIFCFFTLHAIWQQRKNNRQDDLDIATIRERIFAEPNLAGRIKKISNKKSLPTTLKVMGKSILSHAHAKEQWSGVLGVLDNHLELFGYRAIINATSGRCDIDARRFREKTTTLYICMPASDSKDFSALIRLMLTVLGEQLTHTLPTKQDKPVTFLLDEFARIPHLESLIRLPEIARGYKVNLFIIA